MQSNLYERRKILKLGIAASLIYILGNSFEAESKPARGDIIFPKNDILQVHVVPDVVNHVNIEGVVNALASGVPAGEGSYMPDFICLANRIHSEVTGMTYPIHMKRNYGFVKPLEVVVIKGLKKMEMSGAFHNEIDLRDSNRAYIDADSKPPNALTTLAHELQHSCLGIDELLVYANTHKEVSEMIAKFPQLLRAKDYECPLSTMIAYYSKGVGLKSVPLFSRFLEFLTGSPAPEGRSSDNSLTSIQPSLLTYLAWLEANADQGSLNLSNPAKILGDMPEDLRKKVLREAIASLETRKTEYTKALVWAFAEITEDHILKLGVEISESEKALIKRKMAVVLNSIKSSV